MMPPSQKNLPTTLLLLIEMIYYQVYQLFKQNHNFQSLKQSEERPFTPEKRGNSEMVWMALEN